MSETKSAESILCQVEGDWFVVRRGEEVLNLDTTFRHCVSS